MVAVALVGPLQIRLSAGNLGQNTHTHTLRKKKEENILKTV